MKKSIIKEALELSRELEKSQKQLASLIEETIQTYPGLIQHGPRLVRNDPGEVSRLVWGDWKIYFCGGYDNNEQKLLNHSLEVYYQDQYLFKLKSGCITGLFNADYPKSGDSK